MAGTSYPITIAPDEHPLADDEIGRSLDAVRELLSARMEQRGEAQDRLHFLQRECDALECALNALGETTKTIASWKNDARGSDGR